MYTAVQKYNQYWYTVDLERRQEVGIVNHSMGGGGRCPTLRLHSNGCLDPPCKKTGFIQPCTHDHETDFYRGSTNKSSVAI
jgi:hypothetical protein